MTNKSINKWKPAKELFQLEKVEGEIILQYSKSGRHLFSLVCKNEKTHELFLCETGYPPCRFDLYEATDFLAGRASQYSYKIVK